MKTDKNNNIKGIMIIDKPLNITSMDVIRYLRKVTNIRKIGHAGTLDPLATGVLIVAIGKATKRINELMGLTKKYKTTVDLSAFSTTDDAEGKKTKVKVKKIPTKEEIEKIIKKKFIGEIEQTPPIYSAIKVKGKRAYELAREGKEVKMKSRTVTIDRIRIRDYQWPYLKLKIKCSKGTYIRSLGKDIGTALGVGGYLTKLKRTSIGQFKIKQSIKLNKLKSDNWKKYLLNTDVISSTN